MKNIINFTNEYTIKGKSPKPVLYKFLKTAGIIFILMMLLEIWLEGFSFSIISKNSFVIIFLPYALRVLAPNNKLISVNCSLNMENENLIYEIAQIEDENRKVIFPINSITNIQFREKESTVIIEGEPRVEVQNLKNKKFKTHDFRGKRKSIDVRIKNVEKDKLLGDLERNLNRTIEVI